MLHFYMLYYTASAMNKNEEKDTNTHQGTGLTEDRTTLEEKQHHRDLYVITTVLLLKGTNIILQATGIHIWYHIWYSIPNIRGTNLWLTAIRISILTQRQMNPTPMT